METDDVLVFFSDGIVEASDINGEFFGEDRFQYALKQHAAGNAREIRDAILDEVKHFRGKASQNDDIALVIVKYVGRK